MPGAAGDGGDGGVEGGVATVSVTGGGDGGVAGGEQVGMVGHTSSLPLPMHQLVLVGCATQPLKMRLISLH